MTLAVPALVLSPSRRRSRGFSLIELMVVVILIGVITVMAIPNLIIGRSEGHAYNDAASVAELLRIARARALGRNTAVAVYLSSDNALATTFPPSTNLGIYQMVEAQSTVLGATLNTNAASAPFFPIGAPVSSCASATWPSTVPMTAWAAGSPGFYAAVNMNGAIEVQSGIYSVLNTWASGSAAAITSAWICYTPLGHTYLSTTATAPPVFVAGSPMTTVLQVDVMRSGGLTRSVVIQPSGAARIVSH